MDSEGGPPTLKEMAIAVAAGTGIAMVYVALSVVLSQMEWYQNMGDFFHREPLVLVAIIALAFALAIGVIVYVRRRYPEDY